MISTMQQNQVQMREVEGIQELLASDRYERVDGMGEVTVYARVGVPADEAPPP